MSHTLPEFESKRLLAEGGVPIPEERLVSTPDEALAAAEALGYPVAFQALRARDRPQDGARAGASDLSESDAGRAAHRREAERIYTEMGATGHAERVARESGS